MMPKFRAFVKSGTKQTYGGVYEEDAMVPVGVLDITGEEVTVWGCGRENCGVCDDYFRMKDIILMQSTGLEDKNGVDIFEGDIVTLKYPRDRRYKVVAKVINGQEISAMVLKFDNDFSTEEFPLYKISAENNLEVIGNIYENPELLEVAE